MRKHDCYRIALILICLLAILAIPGAARADVAPPSPPKGSNIEPGSETTNVRMMAETVTIEVASQSAYETGNASVTAVFQMRNLSKTEERMDVRFPLYAVETFTGVPGEGAGGFYFYPPLENFSVRVNGIQPPVNNTYEKLINPRYGESPEIEVPAWANFLVIFPPEKDVEIRVQYIQRGFGGYEHRSVNYVKYTYLLFTGAGWKDTIGSADIIVRLPVEANDMTVYERSPDGGSLAGKEIRWHFEDFEPSLESDAGPHYIMAGILQPSYWWKIQETRENAASHPQDGEAWGQLGKALKEAARMEHGFRDDAIGEKWYWESFDAYQKAVELLPKDADWHYGFADLLFHNTWMGQSLERDQNSTEEQISLGLEQLKQALEINPNHPRANELLQGLINFEWVNINGGQWVPLILTPVPTFTTQPIRTPIPQETIVPQKTITLVSTVTRTRAPSLTPTIKATIPPTLASIFFTSTPQADSGSKTPFCGTAFLPGLIVIILLMKRLRASG